MKRLTPLRGLKTSHTDPYGNVTHYNYYQSGPKHRQASQCSRSRSTRQRHLGTEYNGRGEVTKVDPPGRLFMSQGAGYNSDGTLATVTDELGHTTSYTYDEYKRVLTVTNPLNQNRH